ncbi:MAG: hypothetical protein AAF804_12135, partial [Bacteroidota bacterium]
MSWKILTRTGVILISLITILFSSLLMEDGQYSPYTYHMVPQETRKALILTWLSADQHDFWDEYQAHLFPVLAHEHQLGQINLVLPLEHEPLTHPEAD